MCDGVVVVELSRDTVSKTNMAISGECEILAKALSSGTPTAFR